LRPNTRWLTQSLFELESRAGRWPAALATLSQMVKRRLIAADHGRRHRGVIVYELSRAALADGDRRRAMKLAAEAQRLTPELAGPAAHHARLLGEAGQAGAAAKAVERAWRTAPNLELAQVYDTIHGEASPLARLKRFERLAAQNPAARESHLALAEAALAAQLWGEARRRLEAALKATPDAVPTSRLCLMMARLEEAEHQDFARVREWLDRAVTAPPDPRHVCRHCGGESLEWRSRCPHCGHFDTLFWRTPAASAVAATLPATPPTASAPAAELPATSPAAE
jgi:HemY protein